jgi:hypothetical protein
MQRVHEKVFFGLGGVGGRTPAHTTKTEIS